MGAPARRIQPERSCWMPGIGQRPTFRWPAAAGVHRRACSGVSGVKSVNVGSFSQSAISAAPLPPP